MLGEVFLPLTPASPSTIETPTLQVLELNLAKGLSIGLEMFDFSRAAVVAQLEAV